MPALGTLLALKELFKSRRTVTVGPVVLTPADIGRTILVAVPGGTTVTLPRISGDGITGTSALGAGAAICIVAILPVVTVTSPAPTPDTFNVGQAFPDLLGGANDWCIYASDGGATRPSDWIRLCEKVPVPPPPIP